MKNYLNSKIILLIVFGFGFFTQKFFSIGKDTTYPINNISMMMTSSSRYAFSMKKNYKSETVSTNMDGFRDPLNFSEKLQNSEGDFKIVLLGASGMLGYRLKLEDSIQGQIASAFQNNIKKVNIFNLSSIAYQIVQGRLVAQSWIPKIKPDLIILNFGFMEPFGCPALFSDRQIFDIVHDYGLYNLPISIDLIYRFSTISCSRTENSDLLFWKQRVSVYDYIEELLLIKKQLTMFNPTAEIWIIPQTVSSSPAILSSETYKAFIKFREEVEKTEITRQAGFKYFESIKEISSPRYYDEEGTHLNKEGVKKLVLVLHDDLYEYINRRPTLSF